MWGVRLNPEKVIWSPIVKFLAIESAFFRIQPNPHSFFWEDPLEYPLKIYEFYFLF